MSGEQKEQILKLLTHGISLHELDGLLVKAALIKHLGNRTKASRELGITDHTLRSKIYVYGHEVVGFDLAKEKINSSSLEKTEELRVLKIRVNSMETRRKKKNA